MNEFRGISSYDWEQAKGLARLFVLAAFLIVIGIFGSQTFDKVDPREVANRYRETIWFFKYTPQFLLIPFAAVVNWPSIRFMLAPLLAFISVMLAGSFYVKDIYALPSFVDGLRYVIASMFTLGYPHLVIEKGAPKPVKDRVDLIDKIGGPGKISIEPGNVVLFRTVESPLDPTVGSTYFLAPFERIAQIVNLDDQQGDKDEVDAISRDGIKVKVKDIHFRYRILQKKENGIPVRRTLDNPYPYSEAALRNMVYNLQVEKKGLDKWTDAVERSVIGQITDFIAAHSIDYLTAPREGKINTQQEMKNDLLSYEIRRRLEGNGAELIWADVGHIDIDRPEVDDQRASLWAADWVGNSEVLRAFGSAKREAYQELGRAEAQAELIVGIADALEMANMTDRSVENMRRIFLARTAQILDAIRMGSEQLLPPEEEKK